MHIWLEDEQVDNTRQTNPTALSARRQTIMRCTIISPRTAEKWSGCKIRKTNEHDRTEKLFYDVRQEATCTECEKANYCAMCDKTLSEGESALHSMYGSIC